MADLTLSDADNGTIFPAVLELGMRGDALMVNTHFVDEEDIDGTLLFLSFKQIVELRDYLNKLIKENHNNG